MANYVVGSKVKGLVKESGMNAAGTLIDALDQKVAAMLRKAVERAKANGRKTVRDHDI